VTPKTFCRKAVSLARTFPTNPKHVHPSGMDGIDRVRFLAVIAHGKGTREVAVDIPPELIFALADALRATVGMACDTQNSRVVGDRPDGIHMGLAVWHVEHPDMPMPCIDHSRTIDISDRRALHAFEEYKACELRKIEDVP